jgi:microcompartment protein CcmL/EutN
MKQALGLVEIRGLSTAVVVADTMAKAADIRILEIENTKGLGYMTIKIAGDVGAVNAAVSAGRQTGMENQKLVSWKIIARPSDSVEHTFGVVEPLKTVPSGKLLHKEDCQKQAPEGVGEQEVSEEVDAGVELSEGAEADLGLPGETELEAEAEAETETELETETEPETEKETRPETEIKPETKSQPESEPELESKPDSEPPMKKTKPRKPRGSKG